MEEVTIVIDNQDAQYAWWAIGKLRHEKPDDESLDSMAEILQTVTTRGAATMELTFSWSDARKLPVRIYEYADIREQWQHEQAAQPYRDAGRAIERRLVYQGVPVR